MNILTNILIYSANIYTNFYGVIFQGHYKNNFYYKPTFLEYYLYLFPSFINHLYAKLLYKEYLYKKNNLLYLSSYNESKKITPPILGFTITGIELSTIIKKFSNNIPCNYIFSYYGFIFNKEISIKYLKNGIKTKDTCIDEIKNLTLIDILN